MTELYFDQQRDTLVCAGDWNIDAIRSLEHALEKLSPQKLSPEHIDATGIASIDSAGALFLKQLYDRFSHLSDQMADADLSHQSRRMLNLVRRSLSVDSLDSLPQEKESFVTGVGRECVEKAKQLYGAVSLVGEAFHQFMAACFSWRRFRMHSIINVMELAGFRALPIVGLLSFLIGVVLTYQVGIKLQEYGANIYVVFLTGVSVEREFAPLITAVIIAGRTGSSFTAELGSMKVNEEMDAITTMGLSTIELLVLPRLLAMLLVFPLMIFWADVYGILGAMMMSKLMLGVNFTTFLGQLKSQVGLNEFLLGMYKAPVFALLIALVGCFQGFQVNGSADSIGLLTTKSVVQAIFLIIIADAIFSVVYSWFGL